MNIYKYSVSFKANVARFKEFNDYNTGELLRGFTEFMREQGLKNDFLIADEQVMTEKKDEPTIRPGSFYEVK